MIDKTYGAPCLKIELRRLPRSQINVLDRILGWVSSRVCWIVASELRPVWADGGPGAVGAIGVRRCTAEIRSRGSRGATETRLACRNLIGDQRIVERVTAAQGKVRNLQVWTPHAR